MVKAIKHDQHHTSILRWSPVNEERRNPDSGGNDVVKNGFKLTPGLGQVYNDVSRSTHSLASDPPLGNNLYKLLHKTLPELCWGGQ